MKVACLKLIYIPTTFLELCLKVALPQTYSLPLLNKTFVKSFTRFKIKRILAHIKNQKRFTCNAFCVYVVFHKLKITMFTGLNQASALLCSEICTSRINRFQFLYLSNIFFIMTVDSNELRQSNNSKHIIVDMCGGKNIKINSITF